jgi:uncharacterized repeat protein (TIGR01451 family)
MITRIKSCILGFVVLGVILVVEGIAARFPDRVAAASVTQTDFSQLSILKQELVLPEVEISVDQVVASGFERPVQVTHAGDSSGRLFVVEQTGKIRIIDPNGNVRTTSFLDLSGAVVCCGEQGLVGLVFHPSYEQNGYFYVNYTRAGDGATMVVRYQVSSTNPNLANPASGFTILTVAQPYVHHNGGQMFFGPNDGYLYIGMGDGGSWGDPLNHAQNIETLLGAMLRLDVDGGSPYAIPPDNPFVGKAGRDEIWAYGLRNPWRYSFDRQNGDLYIGDVGQNLWEEVSFQAAGTPGGINFGWRCKEGFHDYLFEGDCLTANLTNPIVEYSHEVGRSVTGGFVYRGSTYFDLAGRYFYADYVEGKIWSLYKTSTNPPAFSQPELELDTGFNISAFGEDEQGELYVVDYSGGKIRRLVDVNGPGQGPNLATSSKQVSTPSADPGEVVTYSIHLNNTGALVDRPIGISDTVPNGLEYIPGSLQASQGSVDDSAAPTLGWQGNLSASSQITITYQVSVTGAVQGSIVNTAVVSSPPSSPFSLRAALSVPRSALTTTIQDFFLPGTQPGDLNAGIASAVDCDICHSDPIYGRWRGSMMSQAGRDPLMWSALYRANIDAPNAGEYCLRCHTPSGWFEGRSHPADGSALQDDDINNGVACALCHRMVDPVASTDDEAVAIDQGIRSALANPVPENLVGSGAMILDPEDRRRGPFTFGLSLPYHPAYQTDFLRQDGEAITSARLCGTCHNVSNPILSWDDDKQQFWPNEMDAPAPDFAAGVLFPIETTFDEWLYSDFARGGVYAPTFAGDKPDGIVRTCQDCHMQRAIGQAVDVAFDPVYRNCQTTGCLPEHIFVGGNTWVPTLLQNPAWRLNAEYDNWALDETIAQAELMLEKAALVTVTLATSDTAQIATVRVINQTGHKLPTGYPEGRQMWLNLLAYDEDNNLIYQSGAYNPLTGQLQRDADVKVYEAKQGMTTDLAAFLGQPVGESFHFVLNNTVIKDNRIPPRGVAQAFYDRPGLRPVGATYLDGQYWDDTVYFLPPETARVYVTLYYQTASKEYIDFLRHNGGVDGDTLGSMWSASKSPPEIMAIAWYPNYPTFLPLIFNPTD